MSMLIICVYQWQFFRVWNIMMSLWIVMLTDHRLRSLMENLSVLQAFDDGRRC